MCVFAYVALLYKGAILSVLDAIHCIHCGDA